MRVIFMGTPDFSVPVLDALVSDGHDIVAVYCQPPRPAGRGKKLRNTPVHTRALELGLEVRHPTSLRGAPEQQDFLDLAADVAVVVAYGLILPEPILSAPENGCVNIHASLLPRWRGAAPIHRAIMSGDTETGICIMQMDIGLDTGPVLLSDRLPIGDTETTGQLHDRLSDLGAMLILKALAQLTDLTPQPQPDTGVTYANKIDKAEAQIDWARPASDVSCQIRALSPFPGAWSMAGSDRIKFLGASAVDGTASVSPGTVLDDTLTVACGQGAVQITQAQRAGKGVQETADFLRGFPMPKGSQFEG